MMSANDARYCAKLRRRRVLGLRLFMGLINICMAITMFISAVYFGALITGLGWFFGLASAVFCGVSLLLLDKFNGVRELVKINKELIAMYESWAAEAEGEPSDVPGCDRMDT